MPADVGRLGAGTRFLVAFLPESVRAELTGDLIEEAYTIIAPEHGDRAARRWAGAQVLRSMPRLLSLHFKQKEDDEMKHAKWIAAAAIVMLGILQAWDSGILAAPPMIGAMVVVAIAIGLAGVFVENEAMRLGIAAVVFVLLLAARLLSPVRLPELTLVGLPVFLILVLGPRFMEMARKRGPRGPGAAA
jgi:hypothetical protein